MYLHFKFCEIHPAFFEILCAVDFLQKIKKLHQIHNFAFRKKTKNIFSNTVFVYIAHIKFQKKLAL